MVQWDIVGSRGNPERWTWVCVLGFRVSLWGRTHKVGVVELQWQVLWCQIWAWAGRWCCHRSMGRCGIRWFWAKRRWKPWQREAWRWLFSIEHVGEFELKKLEGLLGGPFLVDCDASSRGSCGRWLVLPWVPYSRVWEIITGVLVREPWVGVWAWPVLWES